jgi:AraC-like DNA-binding protein
MICPMLVGTSMVQIFTNLYFIQHKKVANIYLITAYAIYVYLIIYVQIVGYENVFLKSNSVNLPMYLDIFLELDFILFNLFCLYYIYNILFKFSFKNIYFKRVQRWTFCFFMVIFMQIFFIALSTIFKFPNEFNTYLRIVFALALLLIILYRPNFINKNGSKISFSFFFKSDSFEIKINEIDFNFHFYNKMYWKNQTANLIDFSNIMGVCKDSLFNHIYLKYSMSFDNLINKNRVNYFIEIMKQPENKNLTIDALSKEAGFSSRQQLYKPFKKFHGGNPSDLLDAFAD